MGKVWVFEMSLRYALIFMKFGVDINAGILVSGGCFEICMSVSILWCPSAIKNFSGSWVGSNLFSSVEIGSSQMVMVSPRRFLK